MVTEPRQYPEKLAGSIEDKALVPVQGANQSPREQSHGGRSAGAVSGALRAGGGAISMYEDLAVLFEQSTASGTPIREIFGQDLVEFVEAFVENQPLGQWIGREWNRLISAIARAAGEDTGTDDRTLDGDTASQAIQRPYKNSSHDQVGNMTKNTTST
ncbi:hypothetical protein [Nonomuraea sp. NPDC052265]|uniref:hypothetical protein n=1 Tax=Nonomuraea sp. NPDC052265 TaxID=3364374 RepID=UPI0037CBB96F